MAHKIVIALAPTSGAGTVDGNPVTPEAIAEQVIAGIQAGATLVHLHARDEKGLLTTDLTAFNRAVDLIKNSCDVILEASTGGLSSMTAAERTLPTSNRHAELASLNIGSFNFGDQVYQNSVPDIRFWIETMNSRPIKPSLEIFDTGNMACALHLIEMGLLIPPCNFAFVCNLNWGMPFHPDLLSYLAKQVPAGSHWGANLIGSSDFVQHLEAAHLGASILRVGFEDSRQYDGKTAQTNVELVTALRAELEASGFEIARVDEARQILLG